MATDFKFRWAEQLAGSGLPRPVVEMGKALAHFANTDGTKAHPGNEKLAEFAACSVETVKRNLRPLRRHGWAVVVRPGGRVKGGRSYATEYRLEIGRGVTKDQGVTPDSDQGVTPAKTEVSMGDQGVIPGPDQGVTDDPLQGVNADPPLTSNQSTTNQEPTNTLTPDLLRTVAQLVVDAGAGDRFVLGEAESILRCGGRVRDGWRVPSWVTETLLVLEDLL